MRVTTKEITSIATTLCKHLENCGYSEIEIEKTAYWSIPKEYEYDPYSKPKGYTLGELEDDWIELTKIAQNPNEAVSYGMVWLASVLRAVGQQAEC